MSSRPLKMLISLQSNRQYDGPRDGGEIGPAKRQTDDLLPTYQTRKYVSNFLG